MQKPVTVPIAQLREEPYASVLCYPKPNEAELESRVKELQDLGVSAVEFSGNATAFGVRVPLLGKGFVGMVVIARLNGKKAALKMLRIDADRPDLLHEAHMLTKTNAINVGPKLFGASKNFLLTQLIDGEHLPTWLKTHKEKAIVQKVLAEVLEQCWQLDESGLDHGELSKAPKHVIIDRECKPWLIDFETASDSRKPANVTAICNFLFSGSGEVVRTIAEVLGERNKEEIVAALKSYRKCRSRANFESILKICIG